MAENDNPSPETRQAIQDGINWLANWYKERCEAGIISSKEYALAIDKLKNVRIYTSKQGVNRLTEELENGTLHFEPELEREGASIEDWKECMSEKNVFPFGYCARHITKEPVIIINLDKIYEHNPNKEEVILTVIHELTHLTADIFDSEKAVYDAMHGINIDNDAQRRRDFNLAHNDAVERVEINPIIVTDTNTPLVIPPTDNAERIRNSDTNESRRFLKDGVMFNRYLDDLAEVYARIMEMRYSLGLKANEPVDEEYLNNVEFKDVLDRYKPQIVKTILNDVAEREDVKKQLEYQSMMAQHKTKKLEDEYATEGNSEEQIPKNEVQDSQVSLLRKNENYYS